MLAGGGHYTYSPILIAKGTKVTGSEYSRHPGSAAPNDEVGLIHEERASRKRSRAVLRALRVRSGQRRLGIRKAGEKLSIRA